MTIELKENRECNIFKINSLILLLLLLNVYHFFLEDFFFNVLMIHRHRFFHELIFLYIFFSLKKNYLKKNFYIKKNKE